MGLEIQGAVNSMLGNVNSMQKYVQKMAMQAASGVGEVAADAAEGAVTGGVPGAVAGATMSAQKQAAEMAQQSAYNAIEAKKVQRADSNIKRIGDYMRDYKERTNG